MKSSQDLRIKLKAIDHKSYPAYKDLRDVYNFGSYCLSIDHVQGDPFASPSRLSIHITKEKAEFPPAYYDTYAKRVTLQDHLTRLFAGEISGESSRGRGSGKSGLLNVSRCGQEVLERTACRIENGAVILRFEAGFPAHGRTIDARELEKMLFDILPGCVQNSLFYHKINQKKLQASIELCEDQQAVRRQLKELGLCAFLANGSILPRQSGVSDRPMKDAVSFTSPASMEVTLSLPHRGKVSGMGIRRGITLFVGGGYHGKSTVLQALQNGVYNHIPGDGRELVITDESAWKLRSEDGRSITGVDISPFIRNLPGGRDTVRFSTEDASGSTSQAANLMECMESGSTLLLIDEDTSATNFMVRDNLMQQVVSPKEEPIVPFIERVRSLYTDRGVSSVIVAGSSGSYFHVADTIIQMKDYVPYDITARAKAAASAYPAVSPVETAFPSYVEARRPKANAELKKDDRLKLKAMGTSELLLGRDSVELRYLEQLRDCEQTMALAYLLKYAELQLMDGRKSLAEIADLLEAQLDSRGLESLFDGRDIRSSLARPRRQEVLACISRYRKLRLS